MNTWIDHAFVLVLIVGWPLWSFWGFADFRRRVRAGEPGVLLAGYCETILTQWLLTAAAVMIWASNARDWSSLGFTLPADGWPLAGLAASLALSAFLVAQAWSVRRRPGTHAKLRAQFERITVEILPTTRAERDGFFAVSITAGICEEILFRGYLPWYFAQSLGLGFWPGMVLAAGIFGAIHLYLGVAGAFRATLAGLVFVALFAWTGSLWPGVVLHAVVDLTSGSMAYEVLRSRGPNAPDPPAPVPASSR